MQGLTSNWSLFWTFSSTSFCLFRICYSVRHISLVALESFGPVAFPFHFILILNLLLFPVVIFSANEPTFSISLIFILETFFLQHFFKPLEIILTTHLYKFKFIIPMITPSSHLHCSTFPISSTFMLRFLSLV